MRRTLRSALAILVVLAALACGERQEAAAPGAPAEETPAAGAPTEAPPAEEPAPPAGAAPAAPAAEAAPEGAPAAAAEGAPAPAPASIDFEIYKAGFIVGVSGGKGVLHFE